VNDEYPSDILQFTSKKWIFSKKMVEYFRLH